MAANSIEPGYLEEIPEGPKRASQPEKPLIIPNLRKTFWVLFHLSHGGNGGKVENAKMIVGAWALGNEVTKINGLMCGFLYTSIR